MGDTRYLKDNVVEGQTLLTPSNNGVSTMKSLFPRTLVALAAFSAATAQASQLTVEITDLRTEKGAVMVALIDSAAGWNDGSKAIARRKLTPEGDKLTLAFDDLKPGQYAVQVMHDENGNGKLDTNFIGMPTEGYGFSNNPQVMRRPTYDEARFELGADDATVAVKLR